MLVVKQKGSCQKDVQQVKQDIKKNVDSADIGVLVTMGKTTKNGDIILNCGTEKEIQSVASEIQSKLGENYSVAPRRHCSVVLK